MALALAARPLRHWLLQYRRTWRGSVLGSFATPVLNLAVLGFGLGAVVTIRAPGGTSYVQYVAPALLAAASMQTATGVAAFPVTTAMRFQKVYGAMATAPLSVTDILLGHLAFMALRIVLACAAFTGVLALAGLVGPASAGLMLPAAVLCGVATAAPVAAFAAWQHSDTAIPILMRFVVTPMLLFCGTLYPVDLTPAVLRPVIYLTPLYHGIELCRGFALDTLSAPAAGGHTLALLAWLAGGILVAGRVFRMRLAP
jgi:lipooligosaccharide transport system permease protein